jgi:putative oxidoreductase
LAGGPGILEKQHGSDLALFPGRGKLMLARFLGPKTEAAYTLLRVVSGLMLAFHGLQKVFGVLTPSQPPVGSQLWIGGIIELATGLLIALGLLTVWAAFLASGEMAVAYVQFHWKLQLGAKFFPAVNQGELALLYSLLFLFVACRGAGRWSLDRR